MKYNDFVIELPVDEKIKFELQEKIHRNQAIYYFIGISLGLGFAIVMNTAGGW